MVVDLRGINSLIVPKLVQLPQILDDMCSKRPNIFRTLDMLSAFYQVPLEERSRDRTSFTGPDGRRWRYARCPFGLHNSPSQLNLIVGNLFSDKTRFHSLCCYVDDICIASNDWKSHVQQLELALRTLQEANISCNPRKADVAVPEIEYLGYRNSGDSIRMTNKRIQVIDKISAPKNVKGLQRLLGMFVYWKKLVPFFSKHTYNCLLYTSPSPRD